MAEMNNFKKEFVLRTKEIIDKEYDNIEYEVTLLINCLLGMVALPIEYEKDKNGYEIDLFKRNCVRKFCDLSNHRWSEKKYAKDFKYIRNSIAHLNIRTQPVGNNHKIGEVIFWSFDDNHKKVLDVLISVENLKEFAKYVAEKYLELIK